MKSHLDALVRVNILNYCVLHMCYPLYITKWCFKKWYFKHCIFYRITLGKSTNELVDNAIFAFVSNIIVWTDPYTNKATCKQSKELFYSYLNVNCVFLYSYKKWSRLFKLNFTIPFLEKVLIFSNKTFVFMFW